ncbi:uncharacterized protein SOCE26_081180 [Sorangium cellulosum]|uniref:Secreted protein n=1 Tax=Sorangium cellulosum TaxID=56 RepID=A0A2L0F4Z0_SORCE|nr:uncharacterized protein SOCE26_081180 [Sorangium cellulosum]
MKGYLRCVLGVASSVVFAACIGAPADEGAIVKGEADSAAEEVGTAQEALTWYCEGWDGNGGLYQYCITRCQFHSTREGVGSEDVIGYGQCNARAEEFCQSRGWGTHYDPCWGFYY